jgi:hypothetical protein
MEVQIDHVVALSNAWQTGAFKLTVVQRTALANDPMNLFAVKGRLNSQKGDGDAATWLPPLSKPMCLMHELATAMHLVIFYLRFEMAGW